MAKPNIDGIYLGPVLIFHVDQYHLTALVPHNYCGDQPGMRECYKHSMGYHSKTGWANYGQSRKVKHNERWIEQNRKCK